MFWRFDFLVNGTEVCILKVNGRGIIVFCQGSLMALFLSFCYVSFSPMYANAAIFDVTAYGAIGDGDTDDTNAFIQAWDEFCHDVSPNPTLVIPPTKSFLVGPVSFPGPCQSQPVYIQLLGDIVAPKTKDKWIDCMKNRFWLYFSSIDGLIINGPGQINGEGSVWWENQPAFKECVRPTALHFNKCNGLQLNGTTHIDSPFLHISICNCQGLDLGNLQISAPGDSPNTDGIDISDSSEINIHDSNIQTGDDCVAINGGIYDINVTRVNCGPGHGISIGSLGENNRHDTVEKVRVENCNITGTTNGLRIKTVPGGTGYARGIIFQDIHLENVKKPIIIDQHYCDHPKRANDECAAPPTMDAVQVSDVKYMNIYGSSMSKQAITFNCSGKFNCTEIYTNQVGITGEDVVSYCENTRGEFVDTNPNVMCN